MAALLALALTLAPVTGRTEPSAADKETARTLLDDGDRKLKAHDARGALAAYQAADDIMHVPTTGIEVARAQIQLGLLVEARDTLQRVSRIAQIPGEPAAFGRARAEASKIDSELQQRIPSVRVVVTGLTAGAVAEVTIDGEALPPTAIGQPRRLNPGTRRIVASSRGFASASTDVTLTEGQTREVTIPLTLLPPTDRPATSGAPTAAATAPPPPPTATVVVPPPTATATAPTGGGPRKPALVYGGFGLGALGIIVGSVGGIISLAKTSSIKNDCPDNHCAASARGPIETANRWATISDVGFVVGAVGAGIGLVALIASKGGSSSARAPSIEPTIGLGSAGLRGQF